MKVTLIIALVLLFNGCAIMTKDNLSSKLAEAAPNCIHQHSLTLEIFLHRPTATSQVSLYHSPVFDAAVNKALKKLNCFSKIKQVAFPADEMTFNSNKSAERYLRDLRGRIDTDYVAEIYSYTRSSGIDNDVLSIPYFIWRITSLTSFFSIPYWKPMRSTLKGNISDRAGRTIADITIRNSASKWSWWPLIFVPGKADENRFYQNIIDELARRVSAAISTRDSAKTLKR